MHTYKFYRNIPADGQEYDLIVIGGGPAGCAAAVAAGRAGAKVLLVEATGALGGMGTSGLVNAFDPMTDGKRNIVAGFMKELVKDLYERGQLGPLVTPDWWNEKYLHWTPFAVEGLKLLLDEKTAEAGVETALFSSMIGVDGNPEEKRIEGVVVNNIEGLRFLRGKAYIDASGDAVLAHLAGAECRTNPNPMPCSLCSLHANIDWDLCAQADQEAALRQAIADGHFTQRDLHLPGMLPCAPRMGYLNAGHLFGLDPLSAADRSKAMMEGRKILQQYVSFYRKYVPGCEQMVPVISGALLGVRESRRIVGEYELEFDDYRKRRQFPDQIGVFNKYVDIHVKDTSDTEYERFCEEEAYSGRLQPGECFGIPYGILVPRGWHNLWVAGRCNSSDEKVHGSIRVQPAAVMMGQAAGTAAVQCLRAGVPAYEADTEKLVLELRRQGAYLPQQTLSRKLTAARKDAS